MFLTTSQVIGDFKKKTNRDVTYLLEHFLYRVEKPNLQIQLQQLQNKLKLAYRWHNTTDSFAMPVKVSLSENTYDFIYPSTTWKEMELDNLAMDYFKVAENKLVDVSVESRGMILFSGHFYITMCLFNAAEESD
jgi:hypothetical protein